MAEMNRRSLLGGAAGAAALAPLSAMLWGCVRQGDTGEATSAERAMLDVVSDLVIPATDTPGALATGVPAFVILALNHGLDGSRIFVTDEAAPVRGHPKALPPQGLRVLDQVRAELDRRAGGRVFAALPKPRQVELLTALDAEALAREAPPSPWKTLKDLILVGYYTSEAGATQELRYELVPGAWKPDVPLAQGDRNWSSDWTAVQFG